MTWCESGGTGPRAILLLHGLGATAAVWSGVRREIEQRAIGRTADHISALLREADEREGDGPRRITHLEGAVDVEADQDHWRIGTSDRRAAPRPPRAQDRTT